LGQAHIGPNSNIVPWYSASSSVQIAFMASMRSRSSFQRLLNSVPWSAISSRFQPPPIPNRKRPPES
jgi:hypothetical protein